MVKLALNLSVEVFTNVSTVVVLLGKVILAVTVSTPMLSVTFAAISMTSLVLNCVPLIGLRSNTSGST